MSDFTTQLHDYTDQLNICDTPVAEQTATQTHAVTAICYYKYNIVAQSDVKIEAVTTPANLTSSIVRARSGGKKKFQYAPFSSLSPSLPCPFLPLPLPPLPLEVGSLNSARGMGAL